MSVQFYQDKCNWKVAGPDDCAPRKGFKDVTVIQQYSILGPEEEVKLTKDYLPPSKKDIQRTFKRCQEEALLLKRIVQRQGDRETLARIELCIQSETLCEVFRQIVVHTYESIDITSTPIIMPAPFFELFFRRKEIAAYLDDQDNNEDLKTEIKYLHDFIQKDELTIGKQKEYDSLVRQNKISYGTLWTLFPPNELLILNDGAAPECWLCRDVVPGSAKKMEWLIKGVRLDFDGHDIGLTKQTYPISFRGRVNEIMDISQLPIIPVSYFDGWNEMKAKLIDRGKRCQAFLGGNLDGHAYLQYEGPLWERYDLITKAKSKINQRVVVDYVAYFNREPKRAARLELQDRSKISKEELFFGLTPGSDSETNSNDQEDPAETSSSETTDEGEGLADISSRQITDEEGDAFSRLLKKASSRYDLKNGMDDLFVLCPARIPGYCLATKVWGWMLIDNLKPINHNNLAFESLRIDQTKKSLIQSLVQGHQSADIDDYDDVVSGKGKGLVILLYGNPGIGKTLTAESISELRGSPLYVVSGGELSLDVSKIEAKLQDVFSLGKRWNAIVLLDEADVVMSKRSSSDLEGNAITAVWLRKLEYFEGILFLTTNRNSDFDEAFQSRIHLKIRLPELGPQERTQIWRDRLCSGQNASAWTADIFKTLAKLEINGREIKNLVRTANYYARSKNEPLSLHHIYQVFEVELAMHKNIAETLCEMEKLMGGVNGAQTIK